MLSVGPSKSLMNMDFVKTVNTIEVTFLAKVS